MSIPIALAEDNAVNRNTFRYKVSKYANLQLVFTATDGQECLEILKELPVSNLPQVMFVDIEMPRLDGIQTIAMGKRLFPDIHFVVLTVFDDEEKIFEAIQAGAGGYLLKDESAESIMNAIEHVVEFSGAPLSPAIARKALNLLSHAKLASVTTASTELDTVLSEREKEILNYTIQGFDARQIGDKLFISVLTVRKHIANIYQRLHVNSKAQVINLAHQRRWFS